MITIETRTGRSNSGTETIAVSQANIPKTSWLHYSRSTIIVGVLLAAFVFGTASVMAQSVGLNNATPDASSILDLTATDRGLLIPRMTSAQRLLISSPATGLIVYDTDLAAFQYYNGTIWTALGSTDGDWTESGNYWTNTVDSFGIGVAVPKAPLHVQAAGNYVIGGVTTGATGRGIYGEASHKTGINYGVEGRSVSTNGIGVYGHNDTLVGVTYGVYGEVNSPDGFAGYFAGGNGYFSDSLGIGTTSPSSELDVFGTVTMSGFRLVSGPGNGFVLVSDATGYGTWTDMSTMGDGDWDTLGSYVYNVADSIGIGTMTPTTKLSIEGSTNSVPLLDIRTTIDSAASMVFSTSFRNWQIGQNRPADAPLATDGFFIHDISAGFTRLYITMGGDVGIGNTAPSEKLDVTGTVSMSGFKLTTTPSVGYVLTSDGSGYGTWTDPTSLPTDGDWTNTGNYWTNMTDSFGIGVAAPSNELSIVGSADLSGNILLGGRVEITNTSSSYVFNVENSSSHGIYYNSSNNWWEWRGAGVQQGYIDLDDGQFYLSGDFHVGNASGTDDDYIYFDADLEYLTWDNTSALFYLSDDLNVGGTAEMTGFKLTTTPTAGYVLTSDGSGYGTWTDPTSLPSDGDWSNTGNYWTNMTDSFGIGVAAPTNELSVVGNADLSGNILLGGRVGITNTSSSYVFNVENSSSHGIYYNSSNNWWEWRGAGVQQGYIDLDDGQFYLSGDFHVGNASGTDDDYVYFDANLEYLVWDNTSSLFSLSDDLKVGGTVEMIGFTLTTTPTAGYVLTSDGSGNGSWTDPTAAGNFIDNQTVSAQAASYRINGTGEINGSASTQLDVASSSSGSGVIAIKGSSTAGNFDAGVRGSATSTAAGVHYGIYGEAIGVNGASSNIGLFGYSGGGADNWGANLISEYSSTSGSEDVVVIDRISSGSSTNGIGAGIVFRAENTSGGISYAGRISGILTTASASSSSALTFETQSSGGGLSERVRIDADGDLGIGTTNPQRKLDAQSSSDDFQLRLGHTGSTVNTYDIGRDITDGKLHFYGNQSTWSGYEFEGVGGKYLTIEYDGDIGIGDDTPDGKLEVRQTSTSDIFNLYDNTTNVLTVKDGGYFGVGTSSPLTSAAMTIEQPGTAFGVNGLVIQDSDGYQASLLLNSSSSSGEDRGPRITFQGINGSTKYYSMGIDNVDAAKFKISTGSEQLDSGELLTIDQSGNVVISGELSVVGNDISFLAFNTVSDGISTGWNKIEFNSEKHDDGADFNNSTDQFVAPSAGAYNFSAAVNISGMADGTRYIVALYKNGTEYMRLQGGYTNTTGTWQSYGNSATVKLAASDYVEVYAYVSAGATINGSSTLYTYFSGHKLY